jgi:quercetin dioxygenase-like cupin family protein
MRKLGFALAATVLLGGAATAEEGMQGGHTHTVTPDTIVWGPAPPGLPSGSKMTVLSGNPGAEGSFTLRASLPDGYKVPPHWHGTVENLTILSGTLLLGMGEVVDKTKATVLGPGGFAAMPPEMRHWVVAEGETVLQVHGEGPFSITYVDPADDPRRQAPAPGN